jgi:hypothetical protein
LTTTIAGANTNTTHTTNEAKRGCNHHHHHHPQGQVVSGKWQVSWSTPLMMTTRRRERDNRGARCLIIKIARPADP